MVVALFMGLSNLKGVNVDVKACEEFTQKQDVSMSQFLSECDICVHYGKYGCKIHSVNNKTALVHGYNRSANGSKRRFFG